MSNRAKECEIRACEIPGGDFGMMKRSFIFPPEGSPMTNAERRAPDGDRPASALARALRFGEVRIAELRRGRRDGGRRPGFEAEGREMYLRMSKAAPGRQEKAFFRLPSLEEQVHFEILCEYLDYLEATGLRMRE
jgi:hypothetical protein